MHFVNPVTGKPVFPTLDYQAQLLRPGEETVSKRETSGTFIVVIDGKGSQRSAARPSTGKPTTSGRAELPLAQAHQYRHDDAILYSVSDAALLQNIGQYRARPRRKGKVMQLLQ